MAEQEAGRRPTLRFPARRQGTTDQAPPKSLAEHLLDDMRMKAKLVLMLHGLHVSATPTPEADDER